MHAEFRKLLRKHGVTFSDERLEQSFLDDLQQICESCVHLSNSQMLDAVIDAIPGYVSWIDSDLNYLGVNRALAQSFDREPADFIGQPIGFLAAAGQFLGFASALFQSGEEHHREVIETTFGESAQNKLWYLLVGQKYDHGHKAVIVGIEITALKEAEQTISDHRERMAAAAKMAALGQMAAGLAHEINNPLTVLTGTNSILQRLLMDDTLDMERLTACVQRIETMTKRMTRIIGSCKAFSRELTLEPLEAVSVSDIIERTLELCLGDLKSRSVDLQLPDADSEITVHCRPTQISQVLLNLITNAIDAVQGNASKWIRINIVQSEYTVDIRVTDSGSGIDPEVLEQIFDAFFTTKGPTHGTGLGLSICRGIMADHGGKLYLDHDSPNTCFVVSLPVRDSGSD